MEINTYRQQVANIESQIASLNGSTVTSSNFIETNDKPVKKFMIYLPYAIILIGTGFLVWIIKPKIILKLATDTKGTPVIQLNIKRFLLVWLISFILVAILFYFLYKRRSKCY